jgi:hypothetical protein
MLEVTMLNGGKNTYRFRALKTENLKVEDDSWFVWDVYYMDVK